MSPIQTAPPVQHTPHLSKPKDHLTPLSVFLALLLAATLIALGERGLYDLNRLYNPQYQSCNQGSLLPTLGGESCAAEHYIFTSLLLHSYVSLPLFVFFLALMLFLRNRRLGTWQRALFRVSNTVAIVFGLQFLFEVTLYLFRFHRITAWYFFLTVLALFLITLVIYLERKQARKKAAAGSAH